MPRLRNEQYNFDFVQDKNNFVRAEGWGISVQLLFQNVTLPLNFFFSIYTLMREVFFFNSKIGQEIFVLFLQNYTTYHCISPDVCEL